MRSGRKKSVAAQRVEIEEVDTVSLRPAEQRRAFARGVHGMRWAGSLRDGRRRGEAGHLSAGRQPSRRCPNSQQPRRSDPSRCRRSHSCSRRPSRGHLSCLQTQPAKRRLSVWRIHPSTPATSRRPRSQNLARPKDMAAERPARSAPRRGAAAYGVAYMASENPISKENNTLWQHTTVHTHVT